MRVWLRLWYRRAAWRHCIPGGKAGDCEGAYDDSASLRFLHQYSYCISGLCSRGSFRARAGFCDRLARTANVHGSLTAAGIVL